MQEEIMKKKSDKKWIKQAEIMKVRNFGVQVEQIESGEMNEGESVISEWAKSDDSIVVLNPPVIK